MSDAGNPARIRWWRLPGWFGRQPVWIRAILVGVTAWGLALFCAAPSLFDLNFDWLLRTRAGDYLRLCANPLDREIREPILAYRILPPTLAWLLGGGPVLSLLLPYFATMLALALVYLAAMRRLGERLGCCAALLMGLSYAVTWPNCMPGYPDSFAHAFAAGLLLARRPWIVAGLILGGLLSDERFVLALPFLWLWHDSDTAAGGGWSWRTLAGASGAAAAWLVARHALTAGWIGPGLNPPKVFTAMMQKVLLLEPFQPWEGGWGAWWANVAAAFRWTWFLFVGAAWIEWRGGRRSRALLLTASLAVGTGLTFLVFDVARSVGFLFPAIPVALVWLARADAEQAPRIARIVVWLGLLTPSYWITSGEFFWWWRPLVLRILAHHTGHDPLDWLK